MKQYGYANNIVLPNSKHHHLGNPDMFVSAPVHAFRVLMNKNASPLPRKNREKSYKYLLSNLQLCEALGLELYNIKYHPSFFSLFFHKFDIHAKSPDSIYHKISTGRSITFIAESMNKAHMATRTVTALSLPIHKRLIFLDTQEGTENVIGFKFSDLASIIAQV